MKKWILVIAIILSLLLVSGILFLIYSSCEKDFLVRIYYAGGIVSGIFAFCAFAVAIWTNQTQDKNGKLQRFETTFFNMLDLQQQITKDLIYNEDISDEESDPEYKPIYGRALFQYFWDSLLLRTMYNEDKSKIDFGYEDSPFCYREGLRSLICDFGAREYDCQNIPSYFDHYFRHLYTIIKFVHNTDILNKEDKYKYTSIVRATLSRYELVWIYYNCLFGAGLDKFKPLVEEYSLLKNLRPDLLALSKENKIILSQKNKLTSIKTSSFSGTDYEFNLTLDKDDKEKYYIGAFYTSEKLEEARHLVSSWESFMNN